MKVVQIRAMLAALEDMCRLCNNLEGQESLKKLSSLFENYENQDIKAVTKLVTQSRGAAGFTK